MAMKDTVRGVLPPTARSFDARYGKMENQLTQVVSATDDITRRLQALEQRLAYFENLSYETTRAQRYANAEYLRLSHGSHAPGEKRILVAGWYGADNLGDELMLRAVLSHLPERALSRTTVLLWDNPTYERLSLDLRVSTIHYPTTTWQLEALADAFDIVVWGGGAILDDRQFDGNPENFNTGNLFIRLNEMMIARGKSVWCLGLSSNATLEDEKYLSHLAHIVAEARDFSIRDPYSLATLTDNGISSEQIWRCHDLALADKSLPDLQREIRLDGPNEAEGTFTLGFALFNDESLAGDNARVVDAALDFFEKAMPNASIKARLIPSLNENGFDEHLDELVQELCEHDREQIELAPYIIDLRHSPLPSCDACVCYKYHAALIAGTLGIPFLAVSKGDHPHYKNKMRFLAELMGTPESFVESHDFAVHPEKALCVLAELAQAPRQLDPQVLEDAQSYLGDTCGRIANE